MAGKKDASKQARKKGVRLLTRLLALGLLLSVLWVAAYNIITQRIIQISLLNMEELAKHDGEAVSANVRDEWKDLTSIGVYLRQRNPKTTRDLLAGISSSRNLLGCLRLSLLSDDGYAASSNLTVRRDDILYTLCHTADGPFITRQTNPDAKGPGLGEYLLAGIPITPFTVEGRTYTHIAARLNIDTLSDRLKIDSYGGRGYSSVIDANGYYITSLERSYTVQELDNFYNLLSAGSLPSGTTAASIRERIGQRATFSTEYTRPSGERCLVAFTPMENSDWTFVTMVPRSVFQEQSMALTKVFILLSAIVAIALLVGAVAISRRRDQMLAMEQQHRSELSDALALAEQANRAKTTFLNSMSHDIRTPMNAIIGFTALASTHIDSKERVADYLGKISQSSNHLLSLINDVLDMSRIESGKMVLDEKPENLSEILHTIRDIIQSDIHAKQLDLFIDTVDVQDEDVYCDKLRLNQILLNILSNAMKFTPPNGAVTLRIAQKAVTKSGYATFEFRIRDTGIGMREEYVKTIFEPFSRERSSTVSGIQGTGLGMAITKNIVDMMGGSINVHSELGKGSEFIVTLEFRLQEHPRKALGSVPQLVGLRGLVVDDDMTACQSEAQMLRQIGMRSEWTMHGKEAVVRSKEAIQMGDPFHVYIIDWLMPEMNGIETTRQIRRVVGDDTPIIILTAYDWTDIEEEARQAGVTGFVNKPLFPSDLRRALAAACGGQTDLQEPAPPEEIHFEGKRVLVAEDNMLNREIAVEVLQEAGLIVETAENGQEAVDLLTRSGPGHFDLILMDIQMPILDGYAATQLIRALPDPALANITILAMTANAFEEDRQAAIAAQMNGHIGKPIDVPMLLRTLKEIMEP